MGGAVAEKQAQPNALERALRFTAPEHVSDLRTYDRGWDGVPCVSWFDDEAGRRESVAFYGRNGAAERDRFVAERLECA